MTCLDTSRRYNVGDALQHPWITRKFQDPIPITLSEKQDLFYTKKDLKKLFKILTIFAHVQQKCSILKQYPWSAKQANLENYCNLPSSHLKLDLEVEESSVPYLNERSTSFQKMSFKSGGRLNHASRTRSKQRPQQIVVHSKKNNRGKLQIDQVSTPPSSKMQRNKKKLKKINNRGNEAQSPNSKRQRSKNQGFQSKQSKIITKKNSKFQLKIGKIDKFREDIKKCSNNENFFSQDLNFDNFFSSNKINDISMDSRKHKSSSPSKILKHSINKNVMLENVRRDNSSHYNTLILEEEGKFDIFGQNEVRNLINKENSWESDDMLNKELTGGNLSTKMGTTKIPISRQGSSKMSSFQSSNQMLDKGPFSVARDSHNGKVSSSNHSKFKKLDQQRQSEGDNNDYFEGSPQKMKKKHLPKIGYTKRLNESNRGVVVSGSRSQLNKKPKQNPLKTQEYSNTDVRRGRVNYSERSGARVQKFRIDSENRSKLAREKLKNSLFSIITEKQEESLTTIKNTSRQTEGGGGSILNISILRNLNQFNSNSNSKVLLSNSNLDDISIHRQNRKSPNEISQLKYQVDHGVRQVRRKDQKDLLRSLVEEKQMEIRKNKDKFNQRKLKKGGIHTISCDILPAQRVSSFLKQSDSSFQTRIVQDPFSKNSKVKNHLQIHKGHNSQSRTKNKSRSKFKYSINSSLTNLPKNGNGKSKLGVSKGFMNGLTSIDENSIQEQMQSQLQFYQQQFQQQQNFSNNHLCKPNKNTSILHSPSTKHLENGMIQHPLGRVQSKKSISIKQGRNRSKLNSVDLVEMPGIGKFISSPQTKNLPNFSSQKALRSSLPIPMMDYPFGNKSNPKNEEKRNLPQLRLSQKLPCNILRGNGNSKYAK